MNPRLTSSARTDAGWVRAVNEDSYVARSPLFLVADGMGGHERGDAASSLTIATLTERFPAGTVPTPQQVIEAISEINDRLGELSENMEAICGTTLAGIVLVRLDDGEPEQRCWMIVNIGDSRVYRCDAGDLLQLTVDHSVVQEMVDAQEITSQQARSHPRRHVITRALGVRETVEPDVGLEPITGRQTFLICSDGVTAELSDEQLGRILTSRSPEPHASTDVAYELVEASLAVGGRDNVTAIVVQSQCDDADADAATQDRIARVLADMENMASRG